MICTCGVMKNGACKLCVLQMSANGRCVWGTSGFLYHAVERISHLMCVAYGAEYFCKTCRIGHPDRVFKS